MKPKNIAILIILAVVVIILGGSVYTVDEREQAVITRLGRVVRSVQDAGLHFKTPFLDDVHRFSDMMMASDPEKEDQIYTADKKILLLDSYAIWRIADPVTYLQSFPGGEYYAEARLGEVVYSALRQELGRHTQDEVVVENREAIMDTVTAICNQSMRRTGINVVDVRIKRADLPPENARSVYGRMVAERQREATRYRSNGEREAARIMADAERDAQITRARGSRAAENVRGRGDARALEVYADAYNRDRSFFEFRRSLAAYEAAIDSQSVIVLSGESRFMKYFFGTGR